MTRDDVFQRLCQTFPVAMVVICDGANIAPDQGLSARVDHQITGFTETTPRIAIYETVPGSERYYIEGRRCTKEVYEAEQAKRSM